MNEHHYEQHPEANLQAYYEKVQQCEEEIRKYETQLRLHDRCVAARDVPAWVMVQDQAKTLIHENTLSLRRKELTPYQLGRIQGRLDVLDVVLAVEPLPQGEVDAVKKSITLLRNQIDEYQEVLR